MPIVHRIAVPATALRIRPPFPRDVPFDDRWSQRTRDVQRTRVCQWECGIENRSERLNTRHTLEQCEPLLAEVWHEEAPVSVVPTLEQFFTKDLAVEAQRERVPKIRVSKGLRRCHAMADIRAWKIISPPTGMTYGTLLHEVAHFLTPGSKHGPDFVQQLMCLFHTYADVRVWQMTYAAQLWRVRYRRDLWTVAEVTP